jgi:hypothetical protein
MAFDLADLDSFSGTASLRLDSRGLGALRTERAASPPVGTSPRRDEPRRDSPIRTLAQAIALLRDDTDALLCRFEVDDVLDRHQVNRRP